MLINCWLIVLEVTATKPPVVNAVLGLGRKNMRDVKAIGPGAKPLVPGVNNLCECPVKGGRDELGFTEPVNGLLDVIV